jgi:feruloyl esterase
VLVLVLTGRLTAQTAPAVECAALAGRDLPNTTITSANVLTTGSFTPPGATGTISDLPPFCRVAGVMAPTTESAIRFEVWMPLETWNGKFAGVGNGGWAGTISYGPLGAQLRRGYATASTNTGHEAEPGENAARFAFERPALLEDFAYRSQHETAQQAKTLVQAFYGQAPAHSYFIGCSSGGYQGLMEAQRFPTDYDGIVAGMPANNWTRLMAGDLDGILAVLQDPGSHLPVAALGLLHRGAIAACDANDGVVDGVLDDPRRCSFDPAVLTCDDGSPEPGTCLTPAQVQAARRVYDGLKDPRTGAQLFPGLARGSEPFWPHRDRANPFTIPIAHYKWLVFGDPDWDWTTFRFTDPSDYDAHVKAEERLAPVLNATSPDLRAFRQRGGKLLQYHGWNDQLIAPVNSIDYYESVVSFFEQGQDRTQALADVQRFYRLFMAPGMAHCGGGTGPNTFDMQAVLEDWVERGIAPDRVVATRSVNGVVDRLRPLCPYPQVAVYTGQGDTNDEANFACRNAGGGPQSSPPR